ncbi:hypothetical protein GJV26_14815 [Massilia dura]|uniref:Uncharacterized protein n=1 Tax=Pseudoduganella dura TaxID=321982 RepID=A0A6I3XH52_9BURK|nr:hypothetical protein [Pseudoduganella dura]MUI13723.1 hypothetical protein [Pseudoduganella dura]
MNLSQASFLRLESKNRKRNDAGAQVSVGCAPSYADKQRKNDGGQLARAVCTAKRE